MENSNNTKQEATNKKTQKSKTPWIILLCVGLVCLIGGGIFWANTTMPIHNADSTMLPDSKQVNYIKNTYGDNIAKLVQKGWTGRNSNIVVEVNGNKLTNSNLKESQQFNVASPYGFHINKGGRVNTAVSLYGKLTYNKDNKVVNVDNPSATNSPDVSIIHNINSGKKDILVGTALINQKYMRAGQSSNYSNVTLMTMAAQKQFEINEKNAIERAKENDLQGVWYKVVPVYLSANDVVPVGFNVMGLAYNQLPCLTVNNNGKTVQDKGKRASFEFNYYLKNVQEGYKINYHTGKVSLN